MSRRIIEWLWRVAVLCALGLVCWELQRLHEDIIRPIEEPTSVASESDDVQEGLDAIRGDIDTLAQKVDAILVVLARAK
jgi:hypothetical protein